jgi:hypothetical protein
VDPRGRGVVFVEAAAVGGEAERHMRATLRRFAQLVAATALPHLGGDTEQAHVVALSLVGTLERVAVEWHDGELGMPIERVVDRCVALYLAVLGGAPA